MLQPLRRRTWAPQGQTPIQYQSQKHDRLSVISILVVSPRGYRIRLFFRICQSNITAEAVLDFLRDSGKCISGKKTLILDKWSVHRAGILKEFFQEHRRTIHLEWLPSYAPELNPVEQVWCHSKYADLANLAPKDAEELRIVVRKSLRRKCSQSHLLRSFFKKAGLAL